MSSDIKRFSAPWGKLLWVMTTIGVVIIGGVGVSFLVSPEIPFFVRLPYLALSVIILVACAATIVRGYRLEGDVLIIERLGWEKRVSLKGLRSVRHDKKLLDGALRVGNGGLFAFTGWYWSKALGWFHLAGNDILGRPVLLELDDAKWIVTPDWPEDFVKAAQALIKRP